MKNTSYPIILNNSPGNWGPNLWKFIFCFISVYPEKADIEIIDGAFKFFHSLIHLLPCSGCRESYSIFIKEPDTNINDSSNFISRNNIIKFVFNLREKVNIKIDRQYCINLKYFTKKLDLMVCVKDNTLSGYINILIEVPCIHSHLQDDVFKYLKTKTQYNPFKSMIIINKSKKFISCPVFNEHDKDFLFFFFRSVKCRNIYSELFNSINFDKISTTESFVRYKHLYDKLLFWGSTFLTSNELSEYILI
jgi:hypothetical protein